MPFNIFYQWPEKQHDIINNNLWISEYCWKLVSTGKQKSPIQGNLNHFLSGELANNMHFNITQGKDVIHLGSKKPG